MEKRTETARRCSNRAAVRCFGNPSKMPPRLIILGNRILYFFTLLLLILSTFRLILRICCGIDDLPLSYLYWGVVGVAVGLLLAFKLPWKVLAPLAFWLLVLASLLYALSDLGHSPLVQQTYDTVRAACNHYFESEILKDIFVSMGFINFSLSYVISARDKRFYRVPLGDVLQEQFPEYGHAFVCYTFLILIGLYSCGMSFHIVAFACLCGAIFSLIYTGCMALLFTFGQASKQKMVEYYLVDSNVPSPRKEQQMEEYTSISRLLSASDYINDYYIAHGFVPQVVAGRLWERLSDFQKQLSSLENKEDHPKSGDGPPDRLDDIVTYTWMVAFAATAWRHILYDLPPEQQNELTCLVLHACLKDDDTKLLEDYARFPGGENPCKDLSTPLRSAMPLCGLISYLRSRDTEENPAWYWQGCEACLQAVYQIRLIYPHVAARSGRERNPDTMPRMLFLLLETALLTEISALEKTDIEKGEEFWIRLEEMERSFGQTFASCAQFSEWGLGIVCSYKVDWFRSHQGMLSAYLTYQRLFGLIRPARQPNDQTSFAGKEEASCQMKCMPPRKEPLTSGWWSCPSPPVTTGSARD